MIIIKVVPYNCRTFYLKQGPITDIIIIKIDRLLGVILKRLFFHLFHESQITYSKNCDLFSPKRKYFFKS